MAKWRKQEGEFYEFGPFRVDASERVLLRGGAPVSLTPKLFDTLLALVERSGHVVEKGELMEAVWPDAFVEESNLSSNISLLRKALGEAADGKPFIETVPRRGYRFSSSVRVVRAEGEESAGGPAVLVRRRTRARIVATEEDDDDAGAAPVGPPALPASADELGSLAVLPLRTIPTEPGEDDYLGLGLADALITQLSSTGRVVVRPTSAVRKYADSALTSAEAGRELGVAAVLEGSIQRAGERLRVTVQLTGARHGSVIWAESFRADFTDIFDVQDSIAEQVARALTLRLSGESRERLRKRYTDNVEAYRAYLRGRFFWNKKTDEGFRRAVECFEQAISIDPAYALAYAGIADCHQLLPPYGDYPPTAYVKARTAAERALELDEGLAEAHASLGIIKHTFEWDFAGAERSLRRAVELNPNYATARSWLAQHLSHLARHAEAEREARRALELDPLSLVINTELAWVFYMAEDYGSASAQLRKALDIEPDFPRAHYMLGIVCSAAGEVERARRHFLKFWALSDRPTEGIARLWDYAVEVFRREGLRAFHGAVAEGMASIAAASHFPARVVAIQFARAAERDQAFRWLERAYDERDPGLVMLKAAPDFNSLRGDPRHEDLLRRIGFGKAEARG